MPPNAHSIPISDHHRSLPGGLCLHEIQVSRPELSLAGKDGDIALMLDMAVAVAATGHRFDIIDIPDFIPFGAFLPEFLRFYGVGYGLVCLSLHGTLSLSIRNLWQGPNPGDLTALEAYERIAYRSADIRYGISARYVRELAARETLRGHVVDPFLAVDEEKLSWGLDYQSAGSARQRGHQGSDGVRPDLNFVGRQDQIKGPDLFLYMAANLPRDRIRAINLYGSPVQINGVNSTSILSDIASRRGLIINQNRPLSQNELLKLYALGNGITFTTSRVDTFNLAAFESLMNGCPAVISTACGICDYLDDVWPELPYIKVDPNDIWSALPGVMEIIDNYDGYRAALAKGLNARPRQAYGLDMEAVFATEPQFDSQSRQELSAVATKIGNYLNHRVRSRYLEEKIGESTETARSHARGHMTTDLSGLIPQLVHGTNEVIELTAEGNAPFTDEAAIGNTIRRLRHIIEDRRAERVYAFDLLAKAERLRGNDLLYAVYQTRRFRLSQRVNNASLCHVRDILVENGLPNEARALELIHVGSSQDVYEHLMAQRALCRAPDDSGIEFIEHYNRRENPRVAVLVSVYNAEGKVPQFVQGMRSFVAETLQSLEVIFVDSGSPDGSSAALRRELSKPTPADRALDATIMRTVSRETIQAAWNRALTVVRAPYITFLGADEMMRPDALKILAGILDRQPGVDWVQGNAVVCEVNEHGTPVRDVMTYNRMLDRRFMHYLDCCYMGWVGGLYRRRIHDVAGYYNPTFRAAGDNEFKNRALPLMTVKTIPDVLGTFRNFPEERTTESPVAEIEDLRAWHLPRTVGGMRYAFANQDPTDAVALFLRCLAYRKTYMDITCTDIDLALSVARFLEQDHPDQFCEIQAYLPAVMKAAYTYRQLDNLFTFPRSSPVNMLAKIGSRVKDMALHLAKAEEELRPWLPNVTLGLINDNRYHQHQNVWKSTPKRYHVGPMLGLDDMAGPQDLAELLSSCQSDDPMVDFETAWTSGRFEQARRLFGEPALHVVLPVPPDAMGEETAAFVTEALAQPLTSADGIALLIAGPVARRPQWDSTRVYVLGRAQTKRPVLAACRLPILPYWSPAAVSAMLATAVELVCSGKPALVSRPLFDQLTALFGDMTDAAKSGAVIVCETAEALADAVLAFVLAPTDRRAAASRAARTLAWRLRSSPALRKAVESTSGETARPADGDWLLEWDDEFDAINRAFHSFIERDGELVPRRDRLDRMLSSATARAKLEAVAERLLVRQDAHAQLTRQSFFQTLRERPAAPDARAGLARLFMEAASRPAAASRTAPAPKFDILIPASSADWFMAAFSWFMAAVYAPYLGQHGITVGVAGMELTDSHIIQGVTLLPPGQNEDALVHNARLVVCLGTEEASLRPSVLERLWPLLGHDKPVTGTPGALWFLGTPTLRTIAHSKGEELMRDILSLLSNPDAAATRVRQVSDALARRIGLAC